VDANGKLRALGLVFGEKRAFFACVGDDFIFEESEFSRIAAEEEWPDITRKTFDY
jgi:hypothetical protein